MERARPSRSRRFPCNVSRVGNVSPESGKDSVSIPIRTMRERTSNMTASPVLSAVGQVEGFVDEWKIRHDVAQDGVFEQWPVLPGWIVCVAAPDNAVRARFQRDHHRTSPALD